MLVVDRKNMWESSIRMNQKIIAKLKWIQKKGNVVVNKHERNKQLLIDNDSERDSDHDIDLKDNDLSKKDQKKRNGNWWKN